MRKYYEGLPAAANMQESIIQAQLQSSALLPSFLGRGLRAGRAKAAVAGRRTEDPDNRR